MIAPNPWRYLAAIELTTYTARIGHVTVALQRAVDDVLHEGGVPLRDHAVRLLIVELYERAAIDSVRDEGSMYPCGPERVRSVLTEACQRAATRMVAATRAELVAKLGGAT